MSVIGLEIRRWWGGSGGGGSQTKVKVRLYQNLCCVGVEKN